MITSLLHCPSSSEIPVQNKTNIPKYVYLFSEQNKKGFYDWNMGLDCSSFFMNFDYKGVDRQFYSRKFECNVDPNQALWKCAWSSQTKKDGVEIDSKTIPLDLDGEPRIPQDPLPFEPLPRPFIPVAILAASMSGAITCAALAILETYKCYNRTPETQAMQKGSGWWALGYAGASVALGCIAYSQHLILKA